MIDKAKTSEIDAREFNFSKELLFERKLKLKDFRFLFFTWLGLNVGLMRAFDFEVISCIVIVPVVSLFVYLMLIGVLKTIKIYPDRMVLTNAIGIFQKKEIIEFAEVDDIIFTAAGYRRPSGIWVYYKGIAKPQKFKTQFSELERADLAGWVKKYVKAEFEHDDYYADQAISEKGGR